MADATAAEITAAVAGAGAGTDTSAECPVVSKWLHLNRIQPFFDNNLANVVTVTVNAPEATATAAAPA